MKRTISQSKRKSAIVLNYIMLILFLAAFIWATNSSANTAAIILSILFAAALIGSAFFLFFRTGYMFLSNKRNERELDERQMSDRLRAVSTSYAIYGIFTVLALAFFSWFISETGRTRMPVLDLDSAIFTVAIYLVNFLPASVIAWRERDIPVDATL